MTRLLGSVLALGCMVSAVAAPIPGDSIEPFTLRTQAGSPWHWNPGKETVLTFCAWWCDTWKDQLARIQEVRKATDGLPVDFATVIVDGRWAERSHTDAGGTLVTDPSGDWTHRLGIDRVPYTLVINRLGRVTWASFGTVRSMDIIGAVRNSGQRSTASDVYLTFDDFPSSSGSFELLDLLRAKGVPATFFCIGDHLNVHADIARRAAREGHLLEIHSWSHDGANPELGRCSLAISELTGQKPGLYRPPGSERVLTLDGTALPIPVDDPYDYTRPTSDELVRRVLLGVRAGCLIQLHAGVRETLEALPKIIDNLRDRGFVFRTLSRY